MPIWNAILCEPTYVSFFTIYFFGGGGLKQCPLQQMAV